MSVLVHEPCQDSNSKDWAFEKYTSYSQRIFDVFEKPESVNSWVEFWETPTQKQRFSYTQLSHDARATANWLRNAGYVAGDVAFLAFHPGIDFLRALLGAIHAGLAISPLPVPVGGATHAGLDLNALLNNAGSHLILCDDGGATLVAEEQLDSSIDIRKMRGFSSEPSNEDWSRPEVGPEDLVILQYTSGSTGTPKGVEITQANLIANQREIGAMIETTAEDIFVGWLPHYHDMGLVGQLLHPLAVGSRLALTTPSQFLRRPALWLRMMSEVKATVTVGPDFAYALVAKAVHPEKIAGLNLSTLRIAVTGSEPVRVESLRAFSTLLTPSGFNEKAFRPAYGMAETTLFVSGISESGGYQVIKADLQALEDGFLKQSVTSSSLEIISCGRAAMRTQICIVQPEKTTRYPDGKIGEILVRSASVARGYQGYLKTDKDFSAILEGESYYRTGDLGTLLDGQLYVTGRLKELIIVRGRNIYPQDLERVIISAAGRNSTGSAAAFDGHDSVGLVVELTAAALEHNIEMLHKQLMVAAVEATGTASINLYFVRRGSIPRTTSGKIRRREVSSLIKQGRMALITSQGELA